MAGVALHGFNVTAAEFELIGRAGVAETVKDDFREIVFAYEPMLISLWMDWRSDVFCTRPGEYMGIWLQGQIT